LTPISWLISRIRYFGAILFLSFYIQVPSVSAQSANVLQHPQPQWEIDLSKFGYQGRPPMHLGTEDNWGFWTYQQGVVFTGPNVVAVYFVVRDNPSGTLSAKNKPSPSDAFRLVAVFLSADRGELIKKLDWRLPNATQSVSPSFFFPATKGRFTVGIGNTLSLYSPEFELLAQYDAHQEFEATASPAGDTILLRHSHLVDGKWVSQSDLLDTEQLSVRRSWNGAPPNQFSWGDELAWVSERSLNFKTLDTIPEQLIETSKGLCDYWSFINEHSIAVAECGDTEKLILVSTGGQVIQEFDLGLEQMDGPAVASRNGRRFTIPSYEWGSGRNVNPAKLVARVFNVGEAKPILTLDIPTHYGPDANFHTPRGDTRFGWGGLALSQDGELLATKSGPKVQLFKVSQSWGRENKNDSANLRPVLPQTQRSQASPTPAVEDHIVQQVLSWLPADTETVIAANGPFLLPKLKQEGRGTVGLEKSDQEIENTFKDLTLGLFGFKDGILEKYFNGEKILLAIEGSRDFRAPSGLGEAPFQGGVIAIFGDDITDHANSFMRDSSKLALRTEQIEGQKVEVFQEKLEEDTWTTFVTFPRPNMAVVASDMGYLKEMLGRMNGKSGQRALPGTLSEWKRVNVHAEFWAVRHYDKKDADKDPTSPFGGRKAANQTDDAAIGLTFNFDPAKSKTATISYLSADDNILQNAQKNLFPFESELGAKEMHIRYSRVESGIVAGSYDLSHIESAELFAFALEGLLGHAIYL
jgi:hypothetical protein